MRTPLSLVPPGYFPWLRLAHTSSPPAAQNSKASKLTMALPCFAGTATKTSLTDRESLWPSSKTVRNPGHATLPVACGTCAVHCGIVNIDRVYFCLELLMGFAFSAS